MSTLKLSRRDPSTFARDDESESLPLPRMTLPERVRADYEVMDLTTGPHPMKLVRAQLPDIWQAIDLAQPNMDRSCGLRGMLFVVSDRGRRKDSCLSASKMNRGIERNRDTGFIRRNPIARYRRTISRDRRRSAKYR